MNSDAISTVLSSLKESISIISSAQLTLFKTASILCSSLYVGMITVIGCIGCRLGEGGKLIKKVLAKSGSQNQCLVLLLKMVQNISMTDLWDYVKKLFSKAEESAPNQPLIHEVIKRSEEEKADRKHWQESLVCRRLKDWLGNQYAIFRVLPDDVDEALDFLDTPSSKGFVVHFYKTRYNSRDVTHFLDYLKEKVQALNYRIQVSDRRSYQRAAHAEMTERHYLKPRVGQYDPDNPKFKQRYGNVMIELIFRDDQPWQLKFSATTYRDSQFHEAEAFEELMQAVVSSSL